MLAMLVWKPHLGTLANSLVILGVMVWMYVMWSRYRKRYTIKKTLLLLAPKLVVTLLVVRDIFKNLADLNETKSKLKN